MAFQPLAGESESGGEKRHSKDCSPGKRGEVNEAVQAIREEKRGDDADEMRTTGNAMHRSDDERGVSVSMRTLFGRAM